MKNWLLLLIILSIHLTLLKVLPFTAWPEMFSYAYLLNNGFKLYQDIALPYQPLLPNILAVYYKVFGTGLLPLQIFTWSLILVCDIAIYLISKKIIKDAVLVFIPLIIYIFLQPLLHGNQLWFDLATVPLILFSIVSYFYIKDPYKGIAMGLFIALAFFIKQQVALVFVFLGLYFLIKDRKLLAYFILGSLAPTVLVISYVIANNILSDYLFWTVIVPLYWYPKFPGYIHTPSNFEWLQTLLLLSPTILFLTILKKLDKNFVYIFLLFLALFVTAFPRFEFFRLQPAIALVCVLFAILLNSFKKQSFLILLPILILGIISYVKIPIPFGEQARFYGQSDIKLAEEIGKQVEGKSNYLLGVNSLTYVLTNTLPTKPWVDNYIWYLEIPQVRRRLLRGFEEGNLKVVVWKQPGSNDWYEIGTYQSTEVAWYIKSNFHKTRDLGDVAIWER